MDGGRNAPGVLAVSVVAAFGINVAIFAAVLNAGQAKADIKIVDTPVMEAFVASEPLVAKGIEAPKKFLPRLNTAPPPPEESVPLVTKAAPVDPTKKVPPPKEKIEREKPPKDAPPPKSLDDAMSRFSERYGKATPAIGHKDGSELGTAAKGRLSRGYGDKVAAYIGRAWGPPKTLSEEVLKATVARVTVTIDAEGNVVSHTAPNSLNRDFDVSIEAFFGAHKKMPKPTADEWAVVNAKWRGRLPICFAERQWKRELCR
jgi:hypothetical protein